MGQHQDILCRTITILHTVVTLHGRQAIQIRPRQQHKKRIGRERKRRKQPNYDVCHDSAATPGASQKNERESKTQALEIAQQSLNQMAEQMTAMYNNLQATEKDNGDPTRRRENAEKENKIQRTKEIHQIQ